MVIGLSWSSTSFPVKHSHLYFLENLPFHLSRDKRAWLEKMRMDKSEIIRAAAEMAYEMRFVRHEELPDADEWEDSLTEDDLPF